MRRLILAALMGSHKSITFAGALMAAFLASTGPASANFHCRADRNEIVRWLGAKHQEAVIVMAPTNARGLIEVFASEDRSTWTIIVTWTNPELTCVVDSGVDWTDVPFRFPESGNPGTPAS